MSSTFRMIIPFKGLVGEGVNVIPIPASTNVRTECRLIGVMASFKTDKEAKFIIEEPSLDPMPSYFAIRLPITLNAPVLKQNTMINYQVLYENEELFKNQKEFSFAPFTKTNIAIPFEHDEIKENESYTIKGELVYEDKEGNKIIKEFDQTFEYVKEKSEENMVMNALKAPIEKGGFPLWTITLAFIPLLIILFFVYKKRKKQEKQMPNN